MTEPRETDIALDEGEATRPIPQQSPDAAWRPVDPRPAQDEETVAVHSDPEPAGNPRRVDEGPPVEGWSAAQPMAQVPPTEDRVVAHAVVEESAVEEPVDQHLAAREAVDEPAVDEQPAEESVDLEPAAQETVVEPPAEETVALASEPEASEPTVAVTQETVSYPLPAPPVPTESIFRQPSPTSRADFEPTHVEQVTDEELKLAAERSARRDARTAALAATAPVPQATPEPVIVQQRTNDKFLGSVGLFLLRLVLAAILAVRGLNILTDIPAAQAQFAQTVIPYPSIMAIVTGVAALLIALSLILGLLTRLAGLGIALIGGGALAFVQWGNWSPFIAGRAGFLGDYELLLTVVGILLLCIGAGGWSLDRSVRAGRASNKAERGSITS